MDSPVGILAAVLAAAGLLGVAYAVFTSARVQKTVELYKLENEAQGKRIDTLEKEKANQNERIAALERENAVLKDLATGRSVMEKLAEDIRKGEDLRRQEHVTMMGLLREMQDQIREMWQGVIRLFGEQRR